MKKSQGKIISGITLSQQIDIVPSVYNSGNTFQVDDRRRTVTKYFINFFLAFNVLFIVPAINCSAQQNSTAERDGQHDFDFNIGVWKTHIRRLLHPLTGSNDWVDLNGTVHVRKVLNGRAQLEEIEADGSTGHFEGLTLFLYHPEAHQWAQYFANSEEGILNQPQIGEFKDGQGEFFDQELFNGRSILVRMVWSDVTSDSHHVEQSFSNDGGKTWEPNFVATLTRDKEASTSDERPLPPVSNAADGAHDFDFHFGVWKTHVRRLLKPLSGSDTWADYDGNSVVSKVWGGRASLLELEVNGPTGHIQGFGLRLFNPQSHQWSLNWVNGGSDPFMTTPMVGKFANGQGQFYDQEEFQGRIIMSRNGFSSITPDSSHFEQAFSDDAGKTWETNWIMTFNR
ncbi:hypothetical protein HDF18_08090 [Mucilaginibacter sp. X5P1]|uniref:hypothetical protein n=1 Tax=Mucilaginibacter sp. X5P1 TaxID=2723088 RepID=UPI001621D1AE|nr:hypothetical protein [Mucilaginibacter sp. X5P1]MBB6137614.1 hypothetical protein [Mucilaginibacter sp. X5P1]